MEEHNPDSAGLAGLNLATAQVSAYNAVSGSHSPLWSQPAALRLDQIVSKNAYMGKAAPSDVESFQNFPWLLPDFTILFIHFVHNISQCFSEKQTN